MRSLVCFPFLFFLLSHYFEIVSHYYEITSLFPVSIFLLSHYFQIVSHYFEITYLFSVSIVLLSRYFEIVYLFPVSKFSPSHYFEIAILLRGILSAEVSACDGGWYVRSGDVPHHIMSIMGDASKKNHYLKRKNRSLKC